MPPLISARGMTNIRSRSGGWPGRAEPRQSRRPMPTQPSRRQRPKVRALVGSLNQHPVLYRGSLANVRQPFGCPAGRAAVSPR
jgi:hypothetical protein